MTTGASIDSPPFDAGVREVRVESLLGHRLRGVDGESLGRIEEIVAEIRGTEWVVTEVHVGRGALLERLVELTTLVPRFGAPQRMLGRRRVPWAQIDFSDPSRPRATVRRSELERV
jgi:hypothetical protein